MTTPIKTKQTSSTKSISSIRSTKSTLSESSIKPWGWFWAIAFIFLGISASGPAYALEMKAGTAKTVITPQDATPRVLVTGETHKGVSHDIYARALVLNDGTSRLVIVTYDLNCLDVATPILRVRCRNELKIPPENLVLLATHNHQAPIQIVPDNFAYGRWLADRIFKLIQEAIANEQGPVRLLFGTGTGDFVFHLGATVRDTDIQLLKVVRDEKPVALLFNHPAHPIQNAEDYIDVGHCGYAVEELEKRMPGVGILYADACGGNQFATAPSIAGTNKAQALGAKMADIVMEISARATLGTPGPSSASLVDVTGPIKSKLDIISLPLAPPMPRDRAEQLAKACNMPRDIGLVPYPHKDRHTNWLRELLRRYDQNLPFPKRTTDLVCTDDAFLVDKLPEPREFECRYEETIVSMIGPMIFVAMQGEICAPIGLRIKEEFRKDHPIMVFAYMGEHNLYIPTKQLVQMDVYQGQVIRIQYACPVNWAPEVEQEMGDGVIKMIKSMLPQ